METIAPVAASARRMTIMGTVYPALVLFLPSLLLVLVVLVVVVVVVLLRS